MITLNEHNEQRRKFMQNVSPENGIECPECGEELADTQPANILTVYPPQVCVHCNNCDYKGYRLA